MKRLTIMFIFLVSLAAHAANTIPIVRGTEDGSVDRSWVAETLQKGNPDNVLFIDARPADFYAKQHSDKIPHLDPDLLYEDNGCAKALSMIPADRTVVLICPGPRARESYHNITDPVKDGGCGYTGGNLYWIHTTVTYDDSGVKLK